MDSETLTINTFGFSGAAAAVLSRIELIANKNKEKGLRGVMEGVNVLGAASADLAAFVGQSGTAVQQFKGIYDLIKAVVEKQLSGLNLEATAHSDSIECVQYGTLMAFWAALNNQSVFFELGRTLARQRDSDSVVELALQLGSGKMFGMNSDNSFHMKAARIKLVCGFLDEAPTQHWGASHLIQQIGKEWIGMIKDISPFLTHKAWLALAEQQLSPKLSGQVHASAHEKLTKSLHMISVLEAEALCSICDQRLEETLRINGKELLQLPMISHLIYKKAIDLSDLRTCNSKEASAICMTADKMGGTELYRVLERIQTAIPTLSTSKGSKAFVLDLLSAGHFDIVLKGVPFGFQLPTRKEFMSHLTQLESSQQVKGFANLFYGVKINGTRFSGEAEIMEYIKQCEQFLEAQEVSRALCGALKKDERDCRPADLCGTSHRRQRL